MEVILRLLSELRFVLIAICGICCAAFLFAGLGSLRDLRRAVFRLERSAILGRVFSSWLKAGLCIVIAAGIWAVTGITPRSTVVASDNPLSITPTVAISTAEPTALPTADLSSAPIAMTAAPTDVAVAALAPTVDPNLAAPPQPITPTLAADAAAALPTLPPALSAATAVPTQPVALVAPSPTPAQAQAAAALPTLAPVSTTAPPAPTSAPTEAPVAAPAAAAPESFFMDCPSPDVQITSPVAGENISGAYVVRGTAGFQVGGKYKVEILRPNIESWAFLWENHNSIQNGVLMPNLNSGLFPPGVYVLRVSLVDAAGQETGVACRVAFRIAG
jgi:cytoskeletal protein RodZ